MDKGKLWVSCFPNKNVLICVISVLLMLFFFLVEFKGLLKDGYGKLINLYCRLLVVKLDFHRRNPKFPGNLMIKDEGIDVVCEHDINL